MLVKVEAVLTKEEVAHCRSVLEGAQWVDARVADDAALARWGIEKANS